MTIAICKSLRPSPQQHIGLGAQRPPAALPWTPSPLHALGTVHTDDELLKFIENNLDIEEKDINSLIRAEVKHYANFGYSGKWWHLFIQLCRIISQQSSASRAIFSYPVIKIISYQNFTITYHAVRWFWWYNIHEKDYMIAILIPFVRFRYYCLYKFPLLLI